MPVVHGAAQLRSRWGRDGARTVLDTCGVKVFLPGLSDPETLEMASKLSGTMAARERGHEHDSRHPVMTEDMIRQLPARRDGTGYAFILRNGLSPVIGRPPVIWHGRRRRQLSRRLTRRPVQVPAVLPQAPPGPDDLEWDAVGQVAAAATRVPAEAVGRTPPAESQQTAPQQASLSRPARNRRAWDSIGRCS
jgi:hypothetical protein